MPALDNYTVDVGSILADYGPGEQFATSTQTAAEQTFDLANQKNPLGALFSNLGIDASNYSDTFDYTDDGEEIPNLWLTSDEAKKRYGLSIGDGQRISALAARKYSDGIKLEKTREEILSRASKDIGTQSFLFGIDLITNVLDPINVAASFIPIIGEQRALSWMAKYGPTAGRLAKGTIEGVVGNALLEPITYGLSNRLGYDYTIYNSFMNVAAGGIIGAGFHTGFGKIGDIFGFSEWSKKLEKGQISPEAHHTSLKTAISQALQDENVNVSPILRRFADEGNPNLRALSSIRLIKSAKESAAVFEESFQFETYLNDNFEAVSSVLTDAENKVLKATGKADIVEAQAELGLTINQLTKQIEDMQLQIEEAPAFSRVTLARQMAAVQNQIDDHIEALETLFKSREDLDKFLNEVDDYAKTELTLRESLPFDEEDVQVLNVEQFKDKRLKAVNDLDFKSIKSDADKELLRKAILRAQDLNALDDFTADDLLDMATKQGSLENKWFHNKEAEVEYEAITREAPSNYTETEAKESLEKVIAMFDKEDLPDTTIYDENISQARTDAKVIETAANCIIRGVV